MTKSTHDRLIVVGVLLGAHGIKHEARIRSFTDVPEDIFKYDPFFNEKGEKIFEVTSFRPTKNHFIVSTDPARDREYFEKLKGLKLCVQRNKFEQPEKDEFFVEDLVGLSTLSPTGKELGLVSAVYNFGAGDLIEINTKTSNLVLIPFSLLDVPNINTEEGTITVANFDDWVVN